MADRGANLTNQTPVSGPSPGQMMAEAYRRGLMTPAQAAAYEAAARRGTVNDPYAAARADARTPGGTARGASLAFTSQIPFLNEAGAGLAAGVGTLGDMMQGRPADFGAHWNADRALQQGYQDQVAQAHPMLNTGARAAGLTAQMAALIASGGGAGAPAAAANASRFSRLATGVVRNGTQGGVVAAANAAARPGTLSERANAATNAFAPGAALGAALPIVAASLPGSIAAARRAAGAIRDGAQALAARSANGPGAAADGASAAGPQATPSGPAQWLPPQVADNAQPNGQPPNGVSAAKVLSNEGVPLTPGQWAMSAENRMAQLPLVGAAIRNARLRSQEGLNRALANRALASIGETLPASVPIGPAAADYVRARVADAAERAPGLITSIEPDAQYAADVTKMMSRARAEFPAPINAHFLHAVDKTFHRLNTGDAPADAVDDIFRWFDNNIDDNRDSPNPDEDRYSQHLLNFKDAVAALAGRQNPGFMTDYAGAERGKVLSSLLDSVTALSNGDPNGFSASDLLGAYSAFPASHVSDLTSGAMRQALDLANTAASAMGPWVPGTSAPNPTAQTGAPSIPYGLAGLNAANAFQAASPSAPAARLAQPNAFMPDAFPGLAAAAGTASGYAGNPQRRPTGGGAP